jgi:ATP-dependent Lon protease
VAMTGEISLRGLVLPVGGIKEKVLAAKRAGLKRVLLPSLNRRDLEDIPAGAVEELQFEFLNTVDDALKFALEDAETSSRSAELGGGSEMAAGARA